VDRQSILRPGQAPDRDEHREYRGGDQAEWITGSEACAVLQLLAAEGKPRNGEESNDKANR
jgi:hypothetical protein